MESVTIVYKIEIMQKFHSLMLQQIVSQSSDLISCAAKNLSVMYNE